MRKIYRILLTAVCMLLLMATCACSKGIEGWPKDKLLKKVPPVEVGTMVTSQISEDNKGKGYVMMKVADFSTSDMTSYIRVLIDKGWEMIGSYKLEGTIATFTAKYDDARIYLMCDVEKNELTIQVE